jgi:hypothetical protein
MNPTAARWPECVRNLPVCPRFGLPVPYSSGTAENGTGRFGANDPAAKLACALGRLCGICGGPFAEEELVWLVADRPMHHPVFPDPPSHEACAEASLRLCPRIANPRRGPACGWQMWIARSYELVPGRHAAIDFLPGPAVRTRRFAYTCGRLEEVTDAQEPPATPEPREDTSSSPRSPATSRRALPRSSPRFVRSTKTASRSSGKR